VADDIAPLHVVVLFGTLMRNVAQEDNGVSGFGIKDDMFLLITPTFKLGMFNLRMQIRRFRKMTVLDELEMALTRLVILKVESRINAAGRCGQPVSGRIPFFIPVAVEIHMPFLEVRPRIDVRPIAA
jgi:hypothetical protein